MSGLTDSGRPIVQKLIVLTVALRPLPVVHESRYGSFFRVADYELRCLSHSHFL